MANANEHSTFSTVDMSGKNNHSMFNPAPAQAPTATPKCATCGRDQEAAPSALRLCSSCRKLYYCSKDCQKADWKEHKKRCGSGTPKAQSSSSSGFQSSKAATEALTGLSTKTWLHDKPEAEVFALLIDSYRMRVEDEYVFRGDVSDDSLYGQGDPTVGFRKFLVKAEKESGVLPAWWSKKKRGACIAKGDDEEQTWGSLHCAVEKHDIQEHYGNNMMPMQLRMLAEEILGSNVMAY